MRGWLLMATMGWWLLIVASRLLATETVGEWYGFRQVEFTVDQRAARLVFPESPAPDKPWIWRTEFFGHEPQADLVLLAEGYHVAYLDVQNLYGSPTALDAMDRFYTHCVTTYGLSPRVALEGFSRGGLFSLNWAERHPERVTCIYNDAPVCDFKSWPGGKGRGPGSPDDWQRCLAVYQLTEGEALTYALNPVDHLEPLAAARVPLLHVCGDADEVVPLDENSGLLASRYRKLQAPITLIVKPGVRHHPHSLANPTPIVQFVMAHARSTPAVDAAILCATPQAFQVMQRDASNHALCRLQGWLAEPTDQLEYRVVIASPQGADNLASSAREIIPWTQCMASVTTSEFQADLDLPAGGWYRLELRTLHDGQLRAQRAIEPLGVGEVFVIAGQSNATNCGSQRLSPQSPFVTTFDGRRWRVANDPQPGTADGSRGGSFVPVLGDRLATRLGVPIGFASTGAGATSVRQWLPAGARMRHLPTIDSHVTPVGPGEWACDGVLFAGLMERIERLGPTRCRAILWHQGESDAGQARAGYPAERQITGAQYYDFMKQLINASHERLGVDLPWITAQSTYHSEADPADAEFRAAQSQLWDQRVALRGPDTDALREEYRDGVHFNERGLTAHGEAWAERIIAWLEEQKVVAPSR